MGGGCLQESDHKGRVFKIQPSMEWHINLFYKILKAYFPLPNIGSIIDKMISYSM